MFKFPWLVSILIGLSSQYGLYSKKTLGKRYFAKPSYFTCFQFRLMRTSLTNVLMSTFLNTSVRCNNSYLPGSIWFQKIVFFKFLKFVYNIFHQLLFVIQDQSRNVGKGIDWDQHKSFHKHYHDRHLNWFFKGSFT